MEGAQETDTVQPVGWDQFQTSTDESDSRSFPDTSCSRGRQMREASACPTVLALETGQLVGEG